jgi:hypothetical protein
MSTELTRVEHPDFMEIVKLTWEVEVRANSTASRIAAKFKLLRRGLKRWSKGLAKFKQQLKQCNSIIEILDKLKENGPLYDIEANFRAILKNHVLHILQNQKAYWKKRNTVRWTKLGDESTKFFHAAVTERFRINTITSLDFEDGTVATSHPEKVALLWEEFRKRLGDPIQTEMHFNLGNLVEHHDLQQLDQQITHEEIDEIAKRLPSDKAPGPNGFDGVFLKKCWPIIKQDIYQLCWEFFYNSADIHPINNAFITLVPKVNNPSSVNEFRPISLINCITKIITKVLGNRLEKVIIPLIHTNQYGFIKSRIIQDCLAWAFEYIHQCHYLKRQMIILKLDFTKAFDTVEHTTIIQMMEHLSFSNNWLDWTQKILDTTSTEILLNGVLGKNIHCRRGGGVR